MRNQNIFAPRRKTSYWKSLSVFAAVVLLLLLGFFMNQPESENADLNPDINANAHAGSSEDDEKSPKNDVLEDGEKAYYLLKEEDGLVELYYCDAEGNKELIRTTDIPFQLISEQDQAQFHTGIKVQNEEELDNLLQDFES